MQNIVDYGRIRETISPDEIPTLSFSCSRRRRLLTRSVRGGGGGNSPVILRAGGACTIIQFIEVDTGPWDAAQGRCGKNTAGMP